MSVYILIGVVVGLAVWAAFVRPRQLDHYERRRREIGLPPKRELPGDR